MGKLRRLVVAVALVAGAVGIMPTAAEASHGYCGPTDSGDALSRWLPGCRNFIYDPGYDQLMTRQELWAKRSLYTSSVANFSNNFLWYSHERDVTVSDPNTKWVSCDPSELPGSGGTCSVGEIESDYYGGQPHSGVHQGYMLEAYDDAPQITVSAFEYGGMWIAKACGNWLDEPQRPDPIPFIDGYKFRDDNRNGQWEGNDETALSGWTIKLTRLSSEVGQTNGQSWTDVTDSSGYYRFDLDGLGPGRYRVEEIPQTGWRNYTPISYDIDVEWGGGDRQYRRDFGNAETVVDVHKASMTVVDGPEHIDVDTPTDITVRVAIENLGPAERVDVRDRLTIIPLQPNDCRAEPGFREFEATLVDGAPPVIRDLTFTVVCDKPSNHAFEFDDQLTVLTPHVNDIALDNNQDQIRFDTEVHAETDFGVSAILECDEQTDVGVTATCDATMEVTSSGYGPADAHVAVELTLPDDCVADGGELVMLQANGVVPGAATTLTHQFEVTCSYRSYHPFLLSTAVKPVDPHVFDLVDTNDTAGDGPDIMEVFHDATMQIDDLHLTCDESLGDLTFTCTADVVYSKPGPAPDVSVVLWAELSRSDDCIASEGRTQEQAFTIGGAVPEIRSFTWTLSCPPSDTLHPFEVTVDIEPDLELDPHAVDAPGPESEIWVVPYCLPTVNPHGKKEPQAPGSGMNEDGFYVFGTLPGALGEDVFIRDDGSGTVFGPFANGTRIKWVEGNGADPNISPMGGNNGNGNGNAVAVDYQIKAQGDAQAFYVDEKGVEVSVTCLVPPFPK